MARVTDTAEAYRQMNPNAERELSQRRRRGIVDLIETHRVDLKPRVEFESKEELRRAHLQAAMRGLEKELAHAALLDPGDE